MHRILAVALVVALAGCSQAPSGDVDPTPSDGPGDAVSTNRTALNAPDLDVGQSWTYRTGGYWDTVSEVTIVVARDDADGYLLAAGARDQLSDEVAWDLPYLGRTDTNLRAYFDSEWYGDGLHQARLLDFPLHANKTWTYWDVELVAQPTHVQVLGSTVPGYRIAGEDESRRVIVEYAPSIGYITKFQQVSVSDGAVALSLELAETSKAESWVWFAEDDMVLAQEVANPTNSGTPAAPPTELEVTADHDAVFVWTIGSRGSQAAVAPPPTANQDVWTGETQGNRSPHHEWFDPTEGTWRLSGVAGADDGWVYLQGHTIQWIEASEP